MSPSPRRTPPRLLLLCLLVLAGGALAGCGLFRSSTAPSPEAKPRPLEPLDVEADPDEHPMPPERKLPELATRTRPDYRVRRVPEEPPVLGDLKVPLEREWKYIVIHHSSSRSGNEQIFHNYHKSKLGWLGVGYHFVIGNGHGSSDGAVEVTFRWEQQIHGAHAGVEEYNQHGIGICLVGNFEEGYPTEKQIQSLAALVNYLQERCQIPTNRILLHRHIKNTRCPGKNFPFYEFISLLEH